MKLLKESTYKALQDELKSLKESLAHREELIEKQSEIILEKQKRVEIDGKEATITPGPSSSRDLPQNSFEVIQKSLQVITPQFNFEAIPVIRKLAVINPDVSQALTDLTRLANTGHKIRFDPKVTASQIDEMRDFINTSGKRWHVGAAGVNGCVNKMFRQLMIGGALSNEWVPNSKLDDIEELRFINPEMIRFVVEKNTKGYQPYQKLRNKPIVDIGRELKKLNTNQFKYYAMNGDEDTPYGIPPYIASLEPLNTQKHIIDNLKFVVEYLGALGYLDAKIAKPAMNPGESEPQYIARLQKLLDDTKASVLKGRRDGVNVGFIDEHEFEFKTLAKDAKGITEIFNLNENLVSSALSYDQMFMGRPGATETLVTVMFTKMLAQLKNTQDIVKENLEFGYRLGLTLAGFKFKNLIVDFNRSTITDDMKYQQAQEILVRNCVVKYHYGIIDLEQMADELGYLAPSQSTPRIDINQSDPATGEVKRVNREKSKDASDKRSRDKKKPQGTTRKQKNSDEPRITEDEGGLRIAIG